MASSIFLRSSASPLVSSSTFFTQIKLGNSVVTFKSRSFSTRRLSISCSVAQPETVKKVIEIVSKQLASEEGSVHPDSKFQDLGADSLDQVEIVMALEEAFKISVDESGAEAIVTVQDAANLIEKAKSTGEDKAKAA